MNYIIIRVLATSFAIKRGRFTQDSGFDWFVSRVVLVEGCRRVSTKHHLPVQFIL